MQAMATVEMAVAQGIDNVKARHPHRNTATQRQRCSRDGSTTSNQYRCRSKTETQPQIPVAQAGETFGQRITAQQSQHDETKKKAVELSNAQHNTNNNPLTADQHNACCHVSLPAGNMRAAVRGLAASK